MEQTLFSRRFQATSRFFDPTLRIQTLQHHDQLHYDLALVFHRCFDCSDLQLPPHL